MKVVLLRRVSLIIIVFVLGWAASVGYLSWRYEYDFSPWQNKDESIYTLTNAVFKNRCAGVVRIRPNNEVVTLEQQIKDNSLAYNSCLYDHNEALIDRLKLAVMAESLIGCSLRDNYAEECGKVLRAKIKAEQSLRLKGKSGLSSHADNQQPTH